MESPQLTLMPPDLGTANQNDNRSECSFSEKGETKVSAEDRNSRPRNSVEAENRRPSLLNHHISILDSRRVSSSLRNDDFASSTSNSFVRSSTGTNSQPTENRLVNRNGTASGLELPRLPTLGPGGSVPIDMAQLNLSMGEYSSRGSPPSSTIPAPDFFSIGNNNTNEESQHISTPVDHLRQMYQSLPGPSSSSTDTPVGTFNLKVGNRLNSVPTDIAGINNYLLYPSGQQSDLGSSQAPRSSAWAPTVSDSELSKNNTQGLKSELCSLHNSLSALREIIASRKSRPGYRQPLTSTGDQILLSPSPQRMAHPSSISNNNNTLPLILEEQVKDSWNGAGGSDTAGLISALTEDTDSVAGGMPQKFQQHLLNLLHNFGNRLSQLEGNRISKDYSESAGDEAERARSIGQTLSLNHFMTSTATKNAARDSSNQVWLPDRAFESSVLSDGKEVLCNSPAEMRGTNSSPVKRGKKMLKWKKSQTEALADLACEAVSEKLKVYRLEMGLKHLLESLQSDSRLVLVSSPADGSQNSGSNITELQDQIDSMCLNLRLSKQELTTVKAENKLLKKQLICAAAMKNSANDANGAESSPVKTMQKLFIRTEKDLRIKTLQLTKAINSLKPQAYESLLARSDFGNALKIIAEIVADGKSAAESLALQTNVDACLSNANVRRSPGRQSKSLTTEPPIIRNQKKSTVPVTAVPVTKKKSNTASYSFSVQPVSAVTTYEPEDGDLIDAEVATFTNTRTNKILFTRVSQGIYVYGRLGVKIEISKRSGLPVVIYQNRKWTLSKFAKLHEDKEFEILDNDHRLARSRKGTVGGPSPIADRSLSQDRSKRNDRSGRPSANGSRSTEIRQLSPSGLSGTSETSGSTHRKKKREIERRQLRDTSADLLSKHSARPEINGGNSSSYHLSSSLRNTGSENIARQRTPGNSFEGHNNNNKLSLNVMLQQPPGYQHPRSMGEVAVKRNQRTLRSDHEYQQEMLRFDNDSKNKINNNNNNKYYNDTNNNNISDISPVSALTVSTSCSTPQNAFNLKRTSDFNHASEYSEKFPQQLEPAGNSISSSASTMNSKFTYNVQSDSSPRTRPPTVGRMHNGERRPDVLTAVAPVHFPPNFMRAPHAHHSLSSTDISGVTSMSSSPSLMYNSVGSTGLQHGDSPMASRVGIRSGLYGEHEQRRSNDTMRNHLRTVEDVKVNWQGFQTMGADTRIRNMRPLHGYHGSPMVINNNRPEGYNITVQPR